MKKFGKQVISETYIKEEEKIFLGGEEMINNFTDLVLLIGTNPLPNYVVAKYFLTNNEQLEQIWLVCSEKHSKQSGTEDIAGNIKEVIRKEFNFYTFKEVLLKDVGSASAIRQDLSINFIERASNSSTFHLNYTGGTKSMAVQAYKFFETYGERCSFSYLDGRDFKLKGDDDLNDITRDLRHELGLTFDKLINLHGYEKNDQQNNPAYVEAAKKFEEFIEKGVLKKYLKWKDENIRKIYYDKKGFIEKTKQFLKHNKLCDSQEINRFKEEFNEKTPDLVFELLKTIPKEQSILDNNGDLWVPDNSVTNREFSSRIKPTVSGFLDGKWLENYVYDVILREISRDQMLKGLYENGKIVIEDNWKIKKKNGRKNFELDIIVLNGYQVCVISCTTQSSDSECKNKGFEVIHRARQIGGEEARAILVTCLEDNNSRSVEDFYEDLKDVSGSKTHEFLILGLQELKPGNLWGKIRKHIWGDHL
jgi:hypothetical protein